VKELPRGWSAVGIRELVGSGVFADGDWIESKDQDPRGDVRLIQLADVGVGRFVDKSARFLTSQKAEELGCTYLEQGDVLISRMADPIGRACIFPGDKRRCVTVVDVCIVRPEPERADRTWLMGAINSPDFRASIEVAASGTTRSRVSRGNLGVLPLPVPPLNEQRRIVAKLEALQTRSRRAREALDAVPPLLEKLRQSILAAAFRGDLTKDWRAQQKDLEPAAELLKRIRSQRRQKWETTELAKLKSKGKPHTDDKWRTKYKEPEPADVTGLHELPAGWCWATVDLVGDVLLGRRRSAEEYVVGKEGRVLRPYVRVANVKEDRLALEDVLEMPFNEKELALYTLIPGDIVLSEGQSPELVGQSAIYHGGFEHLCIQATVHRFRAAEYATTSEFAQLVFLNHLHSGYFRAAASLTTNIAHLTSERLKPLRFPLPPLAEQAEVVERARRLLTLLHSQIARLRDLRAAQGTLGDAILSKAFRGELVPQDPNDGPAESILARAGSTNGPTPTNGPPPKRGRPRAAQRAEQAND